MKHHKSVGSHCCQDNETGYRGTQDNNGETVKFSVPGDRLQGELVLWLNLNNILLFNRYI